MTLGLVWALACTDASTPKESIATLAQSAPPLVLPGITVRGVIFIEVDTLRRDHLPAYGYGRDTMPQLGNRAWHQVNGHSAPASWTLPSVSSLFSSVEPARHGMFASGGGGVPLHPFDSPSWPAALGEGGWSTAVFTGNRWFSENSGLSTIFQTAVVAPKEETGQANLGALVPDLLGWLDTLPEDGNFYAHIQPMDPHEPYAPPPEDVAVFRTEPLPFELGPEGISNEQVAELWQTAASVADQAAIEGALVDIYDAQLLGLDRAVDDLLEQLEARGLLAETLVVFSADHGELLGEAAPGVFGHGVRWYQAEAQLPLLLLAPGIEAGVSECLSMNLDLWPTIAEMMGLTPLGDVDGVDLRQGCRTSVRGSDWSQEEALRVYGVASTRSALSHSCATGRNAGTPIGEDADPTETTRADQLEHVDALETRLEEAYTAILAARPSTLCEN